MPLTTTVGWTVTHLLKDGRPLNLEARAQIGRKEAAAPRASLPSGPILTAGLAAGSALLALGLWGLLSSSAHPGHGRPLRTLLGFLAAAATVGLLYLLSRQIRPEGLAAVELALLANASTNQLPGDKDSGDEEMAGQALELLDIDAHGFDETDRRLLRAIIEKFDGGPVGVNTLAAVLSEEVDAIEDIYEPYLLQIGFLQRTPRGRMATRLAYEHLGLKPSGPGGLF